MNRMRLVGTLVATFLVAACGSSGGGGGGASNSYSGKTIQLGAVLSITGAGGVYGPQSRDGAMLAVDQINSSGGINGAQINLTVEDDLERPTQHFRYDLCPRCRKKFASDPLGKEGAQKFDFSEN